MTITDVMPIIETLPHADKFKLMQFLISLLAKEEGIALQTEIPKKQDALFTIIGIAKGDETDASNISTKKTNKDNPFCGMWKDRSDMENVETYVRQLRQGRISYP